MIAQLAHLPNLMRMADVNVRYLCDVNEYRMGVAQRRFKVPLTTKSVTDVLTAPDVGAVVIATEDVSHFDLVMSALRHGKHVFVEKPLCLVPEEAATIAAQADRAGLVVAVGFHKLYDGALSWLADSGAADRERAFLISASDICHDNDLVLSGTLPGQMLTAEFSAGRTDYGASAKWRAIVERWLPGCPDDLAGTYRVFLNLACHDLSVVVELLGEPTGVSHAEFSPDSSRRALVIYEFGPGCRCVLQAGVTSRPWFDQSLRVYTPDSTATIRWPSPFRFAERTRAEVTRMTGRGAEVESVSYAADAGPAFAAELAAFVRAVRGGGRPRGSAAHAAAVVRWQVNAILADAARRGSQPGSPGCGS